MLRRRRPAAKALSSDSSDDDEPLARKITKLAKQKAATIKGDDSSSDSDIGTYLQPIHKLDLDSAFFSLEKAKKVDEFDKIEKSILAGVAKLTDSSASDDGGNGEVNSSPLPTKVNFNQLQDYTRKLEEAKRHIEDYNARKQAETKQLNIENLLAAGEAKTNEKIVESDHFESSDSEKEDWEEVAEKKKVKAIEEKGKPASEGLEIVVNMPTTVKKKKGVDLLMAIKRRINRVRKENQVLIHKVHLLCWIAHGNYLNSIINSQNVLALALSLLPSQQCYPKDRTDLDYLESLVKWYGKAIAYKEKAIPKNKKLEELLNEQISKKTAHNKKMLVYIFLAILRSLGIQSRLVLSFQLEPLRPPSSELHSLSTKAGSSDTIKDVKNIDKSSSTTKNKKPSKEIIKKKQQDSTPKNINSIALAAITNSAAEKGKTQSKPKLRSLSTIKKKVENLPAKSSSNVKDKTNKDSKTTSNSRNTRSKSCTLKKTQNTPSSSTPKSTKENKKNVANKSTIQHNTRSRRHTVSKISQLDGAFDDDFNILQLDGSNDSSSPSKPNLKKLRSAASAKKTNKYKDSSTSEDEFAPTKKTICPPNLKKLKSVDVKNDIIKIMKSRIKEQKDLNRQKTTKKRPSPDSGEDSDYIPEEIPNRKKDSEDDFVPKTKIKKRAQIKPEDDDTKVKKRGMDVWVEVFLETEEKWVSVDVTKGQVHCVKELFSRASHPISYIVAWDNNKKLKDITMRYCQNFNTITRKLRIDSIWWSQTLKPYLGIENARDKEENDELERQQIEKPLPSSISEFKNHPLYVLKRHLLKFEALYPADTPTIGFVRNEAIYSRHCVYTLHSREIWNKHAKVVKLGEQPYKIVKARPKWDKLSNKLITGQDLEIFGPWQTQDYDPPTAENGIVPRNAYGNVELFKECMLPKKTVHLKLPGLNKVAKKLNIDCAAAVVGFDFHGGWNHPTYDGFVVCEEFADVLVAAWEEEQGEIEKREREKIDKRVYGNWRKLIRGLLIRERLKKKYEFGEASTSDVAPKKKAKTEPKTTKKKKKIESGSE